MSKDKDPSPTPPRRVPPQRPGPAGGKRDENRRRRTARLADAGLELFLAGGIEAVTIDRIAQAAGMAKGSFYRYFRDKTDLVAAVFEPVAAALDEAFAACEAALETADSRERVYAAYEILAGQLARMILAWPDVVRLYLQESRSPPTGARQPVGEIAARIRQHAIRITEVARDHGLLRHFDPRVSALATIGAVESLLHAFLSGEDIGDPEAVPEALIALILDGVRR